MNAFLQEGYNNFYHIYNTIIISLPSFKYWKDNIVCFSFVYLLISVLLSLNCFKSSLTDHLIDCIFINFHLNGVVIDAYVIHSRCYSVLYRKGPRTCDCFFFLNRKYLVPAKLSCYYLKGKLILKLFCKQFIWLVCCIWNIWYDANCLLIFFYF